MYVQSKLFKHANSLETTVQDILALNGLPVESVALILTSTDAIRNVTALLNIHKIPCSPGTQHVIEIEGAENILRALEQLQAAHHISPALANDVRENFPSGTNGTCHLQTLTYEYFLKELADLQQMYALFYYNSRTRISSRISAHLLNLTIKIKIVSFFLSKLPTITPPPLKAIVAPQQGATSATEPTERPSDIVKRMLNDDADLANCNHDDPYRPSLSNAFLLPIPDDLSGIFSVAENTARITTARSSRLQSL